MPDFENLASLGGTVVTVIAFLYFMSKQNHEFNKIIGNHLQHAVATELLLSKSLGKLTEAISVLSHKQENRQRTVDRRHEEEKKT